MLHALDDPEEVVLPEEKRTRSDEAVPGPHEPEPRKFRLWKTKFWKRRETYRLEKAERDAQWPVITPDQLE
jgi:hypothetical protein